MGSRTLAGVAAAAGVVLVSALAGGRLVVDPPSASAPAGATVEMAVGPARLPESVSDAAGGAARGAAAGGDARSDPDARLGEPPADEAGLPPRVARPATASGRAGVAAPESEDPAIAARNRREARAALRKAFAHVLRTSPRLAERLARGDAAPGADVHAGAAAAPSDVQMPTAALVAALRHAVAAREASSQVAGEGSAAPAAPPEAPRRMVP